MGPILEMFSYLTINLFVITGELSASSTIANFAVLKGSCGILNCCHFTKPPCVKEHKAKHVWRISPCKKSNKDIYEQGLNVAHQCTTFRFSHFPVSVLSCTISSESRGENATLPFSPLAAACVFTTLMKLIYSFVLPEIHCVLAASARAAGELSVQVCKHMNSSTALASFPLLGFP